MGAFAATGEPPLEDMRAAAPIAGTVIDATDSAAIDGEAGASDAQDAPEEEGLAMRALRVAEPMISGTVLGIDGHPYPNASVEILNAETHDLALIQTDAAGHYSQVVDPGSYFVGVRGGSDDTWADTFYPNVTNPELAQSVTVTETTSVIGLNIRQQRGHSITGSVSPSPIDHGSVSAEGLGFAGSRTGTMSEDGHYSIAGLGDGQYLVYAGGSYQGSVVDGYYGSPTREGATPVVVSGANRTGIDFSLYGRGGITGIVTTAAQDTVQTTRITAHRWDGEQWHGMLTTIGWGAYSLGVGPGSHDLRAGEYTVSFTDPGPAPGQPADEWYYPYCPQYFSGEPSLATADRFPVSPNATTTNINATLTLRGEGCSLDPITPGAPVITGTARSGETLTATPGTWSPANVQLDYQWYAGGSAIPGATASTLVLTAAHVGKAITVKVTGSRPGHQTEEAMSAPTAPVLGLPMTAGTVKIGGIVQAGSTLMANPGTWTPSHVSFTYQWFADGSVIAGATGATFTPDADLEGAIITVTVTANKTGYVTTPATSAGVGPVTLPDLVPGTITLSTLPQVGEAVTAYPGTWHPSSVDLTYEWRIDGVTIAGATTDTYTPTADDAGKLLTVLVHGTEDGYNPATATTHDRQVTPGTIQHGTPTVTGIPSVGSVLTGTPGWVQAGATLTYQWYRDSGVVIPGATELTYTPTVEDIGATLHLCVTASAPGYYETSYGSDLTAHVVGTAVSDDSPLPGADITVTGEGFTAGEQIRIELHSTPVVLGTVIAGADGSFSTVVRIPAGTTPGAHTIWAIGSSGRTSPTPITVVAPAPAPAPAPSPGPAPASAGSSTSSLSATGAESPYGSAALGMLMLLAGAALVAMRRTRRAQ